MKITNGRDGYGLIGVTTGETNINNLKMENSTIEGKSYTGGFIGYAKGKLTINNCSNSGKIKVNYPQVRRFCRICRRRIYNNKLY